MKKQRLKLLIDIEAVRSDTIDQFKSEVFRLLDLYDADNITISHTHFDSTLPDEVPYCSICSCNPDNGGSGVCGCVIGGKMIPNPKKYGYPKPNFGITTELQDPYSPTAKWVSS